MKYKESPAKEIFYFSSLVLVFILLCIAFFGHQGHLLVDCGRCVYMPELMLKGKVLYKDIFVLYGPLSFQINAFLYKILGIHLNTLYFAGIANSFIILTVYYLIARKLTSIKVSWLASFLLMVICIFYYYIPNYIFPYSYAMVYALSAFLISVLLCIYYLESSRSVFLILSALFMGISAVSKIDFIVFGLVLFLIAFYFKPLARKHAVFFILSFVFVPIISWGSVFLQGFGLSDCLNYLQDMREFVSSECLKYFYSHHTGLYPTPAILKALVKVFLRFFYNFSIIFAVFYGFFRLFSKIPPSKARTAIQVICFILLFIVFPKGFFKDIGQVVSLAWLPVSTTVILLLCFKDRLLALVAAAGIAVSLKSYFFINLHIFGTFLIPLLILVNLVFLFDKIPQFLKFIPEKLWTHTCFSVVFLLSLVFMTTNIEYAVKQNSYPIETKKGKIYVSEKWGINSSKLVNYINEEIPPDSTFVMMPEGLMVNFLTDRESASWFHAFTPHFVEKFEQRIIYDMQEKKPDYIFITNQDTNDYYFQFFCQDYAKNICQYVYKNYNYIERMEDPDHKADIIWIDIYKRKK